jgi:glycosyltransferase involved in cell wall biosynthesis
LTRYLLDGRALQDESAVRGIGTYLRGLLGGLQSVGVSQDVGLLLDRGPGLSPPLLAAGFSVHPARLRPLNRHLRPLVDPIQIRRAIASRPPDLYHAVEYGQPLRPSVPVVVTVHDLIPFVMPRHYPWMRRERALAMRQFRRADAVIAVSESTARDLRRIAGVDPVRISVIGEAVTPHRQRNDAEIASLRRRHRLPERFVLAVGTFDPRKRIGVLAEVARRLRHHHDVGLVVAGSQGNFSGVVESSLAIAGLSAHTRLLGHVEQDDLAALYQACECLLFTSAYEGFGLPPLEAMAAGAPVAVFDNSSLREVVGDAGLLVPDGDAGAMADVVSRVLADPTARDLLAARGRERAGSFTWDATAAATLRVYSRVLEAR